MKIIDFEDISHINISPAECVRWVKNAFLLKEESYLPAKYSLKLQNDIFINTMPCYIPELGIFGVKIVSRYPENIPSLDSNILLFDMNTGELIALMDGNWITAMRTGAVASLTIQLLEQNNSESYGILGLGNTARATVLCMLESRPEKKFHFKLLKYKDQANLFEGRFKQYNNVIFEIVYDNRSLIENTDVIISCVTSANNLFGDNSWFKKGVLVVPVHTRGFQNCDMFFDKVIADDTEHVKGFKHFKHFKDFFELHTILSGKNVGRENSNERILSYNIGIALHDVYFAGKIFKLFESKKETVLNKCDMKFWV